MINYNRLAYELKRDISNFSNKISVGLKRPKMKFITQMIYGLLEGNKTHLSEIARSLKESITLKKTIERLSRNLNDFDDNKQVMDNYINIVKQNIKDDYSVIIVDNSDIAKPCSKKLEALTDVRDGSTGEIVKGYQTIEAAVLTSNSKMPLPVYEKVFSAAEKGFISETHENIQCLKSLSEHFGNKCIRTLDRGFDANEYFKYFIKNAERFIIRLKMNRNVIYNGKTQNVLEVTNKYKGNYSLKFKGQNKKDIGCKISYIPVSLCEFPKKELTLIVVYGFGKIPMMLLTNLNSPEKKKISLIVTKVYLMRWRIEEYFKFKKQQFDFENIRVWSLKSIRNFNLIVTITVGYIGIMTSEKKDCIFLKELKECSKRIYDIPKFIYYAIGYGIENILVKTKVGIQSFIPKNLKSQQFDIFKYFKLAVS
ncbi:MAG TPA: transposase [Lactobacillus acetotolerans]|jgi:hypothetical protein|nr:transposase [Lactobacillus acetotolerans]